MSLLPEDLEYLKGHNFNYELREMPGETILIIKNYPLSSMFALDKTDVLIRIPQGYPMSKIDMFWVYPHIKLKETNNFPNQADYFETLLSNNWQRFSRHYDWKPTYNISTHLTVVKDVLINGRG